MMVAGWSLLEAAAQLLERDDREAVLGDFAEANEEAWRGMAGILGLVLRRHLTLWKSWRPWLAGFGLALPSSFLLIGASLSVSRTYQLYAWVFRNSPFIDPEILK